MIRTTEKRLFLSVKIHSQPEVRPGLAPVAVTNNPERISVLFCPPPL